jgi:drug/metabolite transporter (DMT)-like permease
VIKRVPDKWRFSAALLLLAFIWGYNWVIMKKSLQFMGPFDFNAVRMSFGGLVLLLFMLCSRMSVRPRDIGMTILLGLTQTGAGMGLILWALASGGAGKTAILVYTMPFWILIFAWPILSEKIHGLNWLPVIMAFTGMIFLLEPWSLKSTLLSEILAILAGVFWAFGAIIIKLMQKRPGFDIVSVTAWQLVYGSVPLVIAAWLIPQKPVQWTPYLAMGVFYNVVLVCAFAFLLWTFIMNRLPAGVAGMSTLAVPVIGILSSMAELGERPDAWESLGMVFVIAALALLTVLRLRENRKYKPPG